jgi:voltage-gated potassium channel
MDRQTDNGADFVIRPGAVIAESGRIFWHLRAILGGLVGIFVLLSIAMYYLGGAVDTVTRNVAPMGRVFYFCAVTALTIGYGDVVPTMVAGQIAAVLLGVQGVMVTGLVTAVIVYSVQTVAQRLGVRR